MADVDKAKEIWRRADAVCLDVDSTLIKIESTDMLAHCCGAGEKVEEWTRKAMNGSVTFQEALRARLSLMQPSLEQVEAVHKLKPPQEILTPGIEALVALLQSRGTTVYLVSGGFHCMIDPLADYLKIPRTNVFANRILFSETGKYTGFDEEQPTSRTGGKPKVVENLKQKHSIVVMVGDGATDMEAFPPADTFIGFGGNAVREKVKHGAPWFIYDIHVLITELNGESS